MKMNAEEDFYMLVHTGAVYKASELTSEDIQSSDFVCVMLKDGELVEWEP